MPTPGKLELTMLASGETELSIKIDEFPADVKLFKNGWKQFEIDTDQYIFVIAVTPNIFKKLEQAQEKYPHYVAVLVGQVVKFTNIPKIFKKLEQAQEISPQWVGAIVGQVGRNTDQGFLLRDCSVTLSYQSDPLHTLMGDYLPKAKIRSSYLPRWDYRSTLAKLKTYLPNIHGSSAYQPRFALRQILFSYLGSFIGIAALAYITVHTKYHLIAAPFGAAAVLVFALPDSPLAQPRNVIVGNCLGGVVSLVLVHLFGSEPWVMGLAVATAIKLMQLTKTLHPPGGAVALVGVMSNAQWEFLLTPVLAGSIVIVICTVAFNNLVPGRSYPKHWL